MPNPSQDAVRRRKRRRRRRRKLNPRFFIFIAFIVVLIAMISLFVSIVTAPTGLEEVTAPTEKQSFFSKLFGDKAQETEPTEETSPPEPEHIVSSATIVSTGDIMLHTSVMRSGLQDGGYYNYDYMFRYLTPYVEQADFAVANLEVTLAGTDNGYPYSSYPAFNSPDEIVDALKNAGFNLLLTANNHMYDTQEVGFRRTIQIIQNKGLKNLGTTASPNDPKFLIQEINGIKVGMVCYTYESAPENPIPGRVYLNLNAMMEGGDKLINTFRYEALDDFYKEIQGFLNDMRKQGAEATVVFIHWGDEYQTTPSANQRLIAQQLANMDVDIIVGGHPHVIQPIDMLTNAADPNHKTVCLYSMGNAVSNQRIAEMNLKTGHTEDGMLLSFTFDKYSDGTVYLDNVSILPTWVNMRVGNIKEYDILPLDKGTQNQWQTKYDLTAETYQDAVNSYDRTQVLTGDALVRVQKSLAALKEQREEAYQAAFTAPAESIPEKE